MNLAQCIALCRFGFMQRTLFLSCFILSILMHNSCKKEEIILIEDNQAPPDSTIEVVLIENYVNRSYIALLGRKPDNVEFAAGVSTLTSSKFSMASRQVFLDGIINQGEYYFNLYTQSKSRYLLGVDTADIQENIYVFNILLQDPQNAAIYPQIIDERDRLQLLLEIPDDLEGGALDVKGMYRRMVYNYVYDQINMGSQNFVISCFQHFLLRYPTSSELQQAENMVNGLSGVLFLMQADSKIEFLDVFFNSTDYYEGQVRDVFRKFLYREPIIQEVNALAGNYESSGSYSSLLKTVLSSDEYAGL